MSGAWAKIKDANRAVAPEESLAVRAAVMVTVLVAVSALLSEGLVGPGVAAAALIGIPVGFVASWVHRTSDALGFKALLAVALLAAVVAFLGDLTAAAANGFVNVQRPLAEMFLWVQIIHSLHVPARRDLMFSLASSAVMLAVTATSSINLSLGPFLALWGAGLIVSLMLAYRSSINDLPHVTGPDGAISLSRGIPGSAAGGLVLIVVLGAITFGVIPAAQVSRAFTFPVQLAASPNLGTPGSLSNPSLGEGGDVGGDAVAGGFSGRNTFGYFGFAEQLDTSLRGRPDDTLVMRVRAPAPAFWKGQTFDTWDGRTWTNSDDSTETVGGGPPIQVRPSVGTTGLPGEEFVQTFYLEARGPNIVFGAHQMTDIYFGDRFVFEMTDGTILAGVDLEPGTVYTVVSVRPSVTADLLRSADRLGEIPDAITRRYIQVPASTPERVIDLARELTATQPTTFDKVRAIEEWMAANTSYTLDIPPLAPGEDTVDEYLFETRQGFCEQIGTSLVVMLRSQGIPARLVVGFTPGERNPLTGLYEVRGRDAHSWAEVYFPGVGWQGFDPTAQVPLSGDFDPGTASAGLSDYLSSRLGFLASIGGALVAGLGVLGFVVAIGVLGTQVWSARAARRRRSWAEAVLDQIEAAGAIRGRRRAPHETTREYVRALAVGPLPDLRWDEVIEVVSSAHLGGEHVDSGRRSAVERTVSDIVARYPVAAAVRIRATAQKVVDQRTHEEP